MVNIEKGKQPIRQNGKATPIPKDFNPNEPYKMRITSGGSIQSYVDFAIRFLHDNPHTSLILHTLPPSEPPISPNSEAGPSTPKPKTYSTTFLTCTTTIPRLISVVEIIKRTYLEQIRSQQGITKEQGKQKGKQKEKEGIRISKGIWQYTETSLFHPPILSQHEEGEGGEGGDGKSLERVLGGKTKPKMTHHPYLTITLSTKPLGLEVNRNTTLQYVLVKKKNRSKKGKGKGKDSGKGEGDEEGMFVDGEEGEVEEEGAVHETEQGKNKDTTKSSTKNNEPTTDTDDQTQVVKPKIGIKRNSENSQEGDTIGKKRKLTEGAKK